MARSIMQRTKECYLCRKEAAAADYYGELTDKGLHRHHVIFGKGYRSLSEKHGLWVYLCYEHHEGSTGVHKNKEINVELRQQAERAFLKNGMDADIHPELFRRKRNKSHKDRSGESIKREEHWKQGIHGRYEH